MKFLVADWGPEKFRHILESQYLDAPLPDGPAPITPTDPRRDHVGIHRQKDGRFYLGLAPRVGRMSGTLLSQVAELAEGHGSRRVRTTIEQKLIILDIAEDQLPSLTAGLDAIDLPAQPSTFRRQTMACTGIEFCKLAIVNTKDRAMQVVADLERRLPDFDEPITFNFNGCPNSCARIQTADIGLRGQIVTTDTGEQVEGFQVQLGGGLSADIGFGRKVRGLKVAADDLPDYLERILARYTETRTGGESFASWVSHVTEPELT
jgi:sulfite reductase (ferredoxin)